MSMECASPCALAADERGQNADDRRHRAAADIRDEHARQLAGLLRRGRSADSMPDIDT